MINPRGTRIYKADICKTLENLFLIIAENHGFEIYSIPTIIYEEVFKEKLDVMNETGMFSLYDSNRRKLVLKPEVTTILAKYYLESGLNRLVCSYSERAFRHEKPGKHRYREFTQFGIEHISNVQEYGVVNVLKFLVEFLQQLNIKYKIMINFIDTNDDIWSENLKDEVIKNKSLLSREALKNFNKGEYITTIDKSPHIKIKNKYNVKNHLHLLRIKNLLKINNIIYSENPCIVRGLSYYSGLVFEVEVEGVIIAGGGEYSKLFNYLKSKNFGTIYSSGLAIGADRLSQFVVPEYKHKLLKLIPHYEPLNSENICIYKTSIKNKKQYKNSIKEIIK